MAITIDLIKDYCGQLELNYQEKENALLLVFDHKLPTGGVAEIGMMIRLPEDGELFVLECTAIPPGKTEHIENREMFFFNLLHFGWATPFGATEADTDGELRYRVEIPLEDNTLTFKQFNRILSTALDGAAMVKAIFLKFAGSERKPAKEDVSDDEKKMLVIGAVKALTILANPAAPAEAKQQAQDILDTVSRILPTEIIDTLRAKVAAEMGGAGSGTTRQL